METTLQESPAPLVTVWIGLDVGKDTLDTCLLKTTGKPQHKSFQNEPAGHEKLLHWVLQLASDQMCHFAMEVTGAYNQAIATFLAHKQQRVSVLNPARVKYSGIALGRGNKTDKADALTIAQYCRLHSPPLWREATPEIQHLRALVRRLADVHGLLAQEKNRPAFRAFFRQFTSR